MRINKKISARPPAPDLLVLALEVSIIKKAGYLRVCKCVWARETSTVSPHDAPPIGERRFYISSLIFTRL